MEVIILIVLFGLFFIYTYIKDSKLKDQIVFLESTLREALIDLDSERIFRRQADQQVDLMNARLQGHKESTLSPDNSVPKSLHMEKVIEMSSEVENLRGRLNDMTCKFEESRGKQISARVKMGQIGEQFACIHTNFKYDRKETKALLQPVDFVCFEENEVVFVDIKTGNAQLSSKQRRIRDNIRNGRVRFEIFRINEDGANWEE